MDDDSTPMSRTELAMLWDLCGRWLASHPYSAHHSLMAVDGCHMVRQLIDAELTDRFGG